MIKGENSRFMLFKTCWTDPMFTVTLSAQIILKQTLFANESIKQLVIHFECHLLYIHQQTLEGFHPTRQGSPLDNLTSTLYSSRVNPWEAGWGTCHCWFQSRQKTVVRRTTLRALLYHDLQSSVLWRMIEFEFSFEPSLSISAHRYYVNLWDNAPSTYVLLLHVLKECTRSGEGPLQIEVPNLDQSLHNS